MKIFGLNITRSASASATGKRRPPSIRLNRFLDAARLGRLEESWTATPQTADSIIFNDWKTTVARCIDQGNNAPHGRRFLSLLRDNVPGPLGFSLQANVRNASGSKDVRANKAIEEAYKDFSKAGNFEITGKMSRTGVERQAIATCATHGECLILRVVDRDVNKWGVTFQVIDPLMVDSTYFADLGDGRCVRCGIEMDPSRRPLAIYLQEYDSWGQSHFESYERRKRIPIDRITHVYLPELINQPRGLPWMRTSVWQMRMLKGYGDAAVTNARIGASKMGFFRDEEAPDSDDEIIEAAEPGAFEDIGTRKFEQWDPQYPNGEFDSFTKSCLHWLASGLLVSYHSLTGDLSSVNFSSIRQGELDQREVWKGLQNWFSESFCQPLFEQWLEIALLSDSIQIGNTPLRLDRLDKYKNVVWVGRRWDWVDPLKDISAKEKEIALGINTRARVIRERSNEDPEDIFAEVEEERKRFPPPAPKQSASKPELEDDPEDEEEKPGKE